jgi:predicted NACHT family NTPase
MSLLLQYTAHKNTKQIAEVISEKIEIEKVIIFDEKITQFLIEISKKSTSIRSYYKLSAVRAFYLENAFINKPKYALSRSLDSQYNEDIKSALNGVIFSLDAPMAIDLACYQALNPQQIHKINLALNLINIFYGCAVSHGFEFEQDLQKLKVQLPSSIENKQQLNQWWLSKGKFWTQQLRAVMVKHRRIGHDWQFNHYQQEVLNRYYRINKKIVDILWIKPDMSPQTKEEIENTLLLPKAIAQKL